MWERCLRRMGRCCGSTVPGNVGWHSSAWRLARHPLWIPMKSRRRRGGECCLPVRWRFGELPKKHGNRAYRMSMLSGSDHGCKKNIFFNRRQPPWMPLNRADVGCCPFNGNPRQPHHTQCQGYSVRAFSAQGLSNQHYEQKQGPKRTYTLSHYRSANKCGASRKRDEQVEPFPP